MSLQLSARAYKLTRVTYVELGHCRIASCNECSVIPSTTGSSERELDLWQGRHRIGIGRVRRRTRLCGKVNATGFSVCHVDYANTSLVQRCTSDKWTGSGLPLFLFHTRYLQSPPRSITSRPRNMSTLPQVSPHFGPRECPLTVRSTTVSW